MTKTLRLGLMAALMLLVSPMVQAQTTLKDAVFSAIEKRIIREHFGVPAQAQTSEDQTAPEWAVKDGDDDEQRDDKAKKNKGKDKGKGKSKGLPPGLAKRDALPPGLAKQLADKGRLPPGLAKRDLPADLASQLPKRPADQEVKVVEGDVVLLDTATGIILDVLKDVVRNGTPTANSDGTLAPPSSQDQGVEDNFLDTLFKSIFNSGN